MVSFSSATTFVVLALGVLFVSSVFAGSAELAEVSQDVCAECATTLAACSQEDPTSIPRICACNQDYIDCLTAPACVGLFGEAAATACAGYAGVCPSITCSDQTQSLCGACLTDYQGAVLSGNLCGALADLQSCYSSNSCSIQMQGFDLSCPTYTSICSGLNCGTVSDPCLQCSQVLSSCLVSGPGTSTGVCGCFEPYLTCLSTSSCGADDVYDQSCFVYQSTCPDLSCSGTPSSCTTCGVNYVACAKNSATNGVSGVCDCMSDYVDCLGSDCGLELPLQSQCQAYGSLCPEVTACSEARKGVSAGVDALINEHREEAQEFIKNALSIQGAEILSNAVEGSTVVMQVVLDFLEGEINLEELRESLKTQFATYFRVSASLIRVTERLTPGLKRATQAYDVEVQSASSSTSDSVSVAPAIITMALLVVMALF